MATTSRTRPSAGLLSNLSPRNAANAAAFSQSLGGSSTSVPGSSLNPALSSQGRRIVQAQTSSLGSTRLSGAGIAGNAGNAGTTTASGSLTILAIQPESQFWIWVQRILGILAFILATICFIFPYYAALTANRLATKSNMLANVGNGWARWAQCIAPGSPIANATWCLEHQTPDTFDSGFNMNRRSITILNSIQYFISPGGWIKLCLMVNTALFFTFLRFLQVLRLLINNKATRRRIANIALILNCFTTVLLTYFGFLEKGLLEIISGKIIFVFISSLLVAFHVNRWILRMRGHRNAIFC